MFGGLQEKVLTETFVHTLYEKKFEWSRLRKVVTSFENCKKVLSDKSENRVKENRFTNNEIGVK